MTDQATTEEQPVTRQALLARDVSTIPEEELAEWYAKHGLTPDKDGVFAEMPYGQEATSREQILEQVAANALRHDVPNAQPREYTNRTMVYIGGGPSIRQFLPEIKGRCESEQYDVYTSNMTCGWLLSQGVRPNIHIIVDPKQRKVHDLDYLDEHEPVELLLGMQCHPDLFDRAKEKGAKVRKFLATSVTGEDGKSDREAALAACTPEDPTFLGIGGGSMCGTRMIYLAAAMGYRTIEFYGVDGSIEKREDNVVNCYAYNKPRGEHVLETELASGRKFFTTMTLARQGEELVALRDRLPGLNVKFHGDTLMAEQNRLYEEMRKPLDQAWTPQHYAKWTGEVPEEAWSGDPRFDPAPRVFMLAAQLQKQMGYCHVLDYGCGSGRLKHNLYAAFPALQNVFVHEWDPFYPGKQSIDQPAPADVVFVGNVMEYVEPECVEYVLREIRTMTSKVAIFMIHAERKEGAGYPIDWWASMLRKHFVIVEQSLDGPSDMVFACQRHPA